ncbi:MAG: hypothetical protein JO126_00880 [Alphaproteobacteria bacterium]|nr:hypothetical protein [Alphaproteobacteria bacterium]MBV8547993.1 hypothetical protein [Alphaproteobacteria bacterium]
MARSALLAGIVSLVLGATPAHAAELATHPLSIRAGDNATDAAADLGGAPSTDPSLALANASVSTDSLSNFGPSSGTVVGNRALELRDEILRLRASVNLNSNEFAVLRASGAAGAVQYHSTVAAITARLQNGTTRGNPILLRQWEEANSSLDEVTSSLARLNGLETAVDADASLASYLLESIQAAFQLSGAVDEDHDQLKLLRDEVSRMVVQLDYLRNQTTGDIQRQTSYLTTERANLQALSFAISRGELLGNSLSNRPVIVNTSPVASMPSGVVGGPAPMSPRDLMQESVPAAAPVANVGVAPSVGRLLVLIRYNQPNVEYEQQLSQAVGTAIERRPNAEFSVVAVSPSSGDPAELAKEEESARRNAENVKRSLIQLGLSPSRISVANTQAQTAQSPEVHVYIR